jgi:ATP-dependent DNA helicase RecG
MLARLLEDIEVPGSGRTVAENRGTGLLEVARALRQAGLEPPVVVENVREFRVIVHNHALLDESAVAWLASLDTDGLSDRQRLGLAFLHRNPGMSTAQYRTLTGCDPRTAVEDLSALALRGLVVRNRERGLTVWSLVQHEPADQDNGGGPGRNRPQNGSSSFGGTASGGAADNTLSARTGDRSENVRRFLGNGPRSVQEIAEFLGVSKEAARRVLRQLEKASIVAPTEPDRRSPRNRWRLADSS